ncbi:rCG49879 [Rattus norvegicus]|uniref:RCG49879 n=1 Tax=Rattus norvegicus TaxID=10116 RepID=A6K4K4_RAT|nr:rCG49879 [Rattus norvegicus]
MESRCRATLSRCGSPMLLSLSLSLVLPEESTALLPIVSAHCNHSLPQCSGF